MAFRIEESVVRGEIDNRVKDIVRGRIWVEGRAEPIQLELQGNAWPDLAGCLLTFTNPQKRISHPQLDSLDAVQRGSIGDLTASRKVRVYDVPLPEALAMARRKETAPEHMANCLYLEWFSEANGRVVIESAGYEMTISAPEWRLTAAEEEARAKQAAAGMETFMQTINEKLEAQREGLKDFEEDWDEHDYEKFLKERDASTDKYMELLDKYRHSKEALARIAREMGWDDEDEDETDGDDERMSAEEMNAICEAAANEPEPEPDPLREGIDWVRSADGDLHHPLERRCFESGIKFRRQADKLGSRQSGDKDLEEFLFEFHMTGAKLAGALGPTARGEGFPEAAFTVAYLKRALDHLHKSQAGLEATARKTLLPEVCVAEARKELFEIREEILRLMEEFRRQQ